MPSRAEVREAFAEGTLRVEVDAPVGAGNLTSHVAGGLELGGQVTWVHVLSKPAGGEIRGYAKVGDVLRLRLPAYPVHWTELDAEVCERLGCVRVQLPRAHFRCHCCGDGFYTDKPQDPERDDGFGTCDRCHDFVSRGWVKHGFPGERPITLEEAKARLNAYA